jgi:hypothetical protein
MRMLAWLLIPSFPVWAVAAVANMIGHPSPSHPDRATLVRQGERRVALFLAMMVTMPQPEYGCYIEVGQKPTSL